MKRLAKDVEYHYWPGGGSWCAVVYDDITERVGYWYGSREACESVDPRDVILH